MDVQLDNVSRMFVGRSSYILRVRMANVPYRATRTPVSLAVRQAL